MRSKSIHVLCNFPTALQLSLSCRKYVVPQNRRSQHDEQLHSIRAALYPASSYTEPATNPSQRCCGEAGEVCKTRLTRHPTIARIELRSAHLTPSIAAAALETLRGEHDMRDYSTRGSGFATALRCNGCVTRLFTITRWAVSDGRSCTC